MRILGRKQQEYVTRSAHGMYPVGTPCLVHRDDDEQLLLTFADGAALRMPMGYHAEGLEDPDAFRDMTTLMDAVFLRSCDEAAEALEKEVSV